MTAPPGHDLYDTAGLRHRVQVFNRSLPGPLPTAKPPDDAPHRERCLRGKADFAGNTQFPANTAFTATAAIAVAAVR